MELRVDLRSYNETVLSLAGDARETGRQVVLATASNRKYAEGIASHLEVFDPVLASDADTNLAERATVARLERLYGDCGFDYIGNSLKDIPIWKQARRALVAAR